MKLFLQILALGILVGIPEYRSSGTPESVRFRESKDEKVFDTAPALTVDTVLRDVLQNNPSLKAARANWEAMKQRVPQARAWEDLRGGFDSVAGRFVSIPPNSFTDQRLMVEQAVPLSGKNLLRGKAAEAEAIAAYGDFRRRELDLVARARSFYYRLGNAYEQLKINQSNTELLERFVEISRAKYEV